MGDRILDVQVDRQGLFWMSYFDQGVYGDMPDPRLGYPVSSHGLTGFDADGSLVWFNDQVTGAVINDFYAPNETGSECWFYACTDFDLTRIDETGEVTSWPTLVRGAMRSPSVENVS